MRYASRLRKAFYQLNRKAKNGKIKLVDDIHEKAEALNIKTIALTSHNALINEIILQSLIKTE